MGLNVTLCVTGRCAIPTCGRRHYIFDVALSRSKHLTVGGGLPAMNDDAIFLKYRVDCIAGKPPPTVRGRSKTRA